MSELLDSEKKACIKKGIAKDLDSLLGRDCSAFLSVMICRYPGGMTRILSSVAGEVPAEDILNYGANGIQRCWPRPSRRKRKIPRRPLLLRIKGEEI